MNYGMCVVWEYSWWDKVFCLFCLTRCENIASILQTIIVLFVLCYITSYLYSFHFHHSNCSLPPPPAFEGPLAPNTLLQQGKKILEDKIIGPESLAYYKGVLMLWWGLAPISQEFNSRYGVRAVCANGFPIHARSRRFSSPVQDLQLLKKMQKLTF